MRPLLYEIIAPAKFRLLGVILFSAAVSAVSVLQPMLMQKGIDEGILKGDSHAFVFWFSLIVAAALGATILSIVNRIYYTSVSMRLLFAFRERVFASLFSHNRSFFGRYPSGELLSRVQGDVNELQQFATDSLLALFSALIGLIGVVWVIRTYSPELTLAALALLPFEFLAMRPLYKPMESSVRSLRENNAALSQSFLESFRNMPLFQNYNALGLAKNTLSTLHERQKVLTLRNLRLQIGFSQIPALITMIGRNAIFLYGGFMVMQHQMKLGEVIAFLTYFGMVLGPVQTLLGVLNAYPKAKISFQRLTEILPSETKPHTPVRSENAPLLCVRSLEYTLPHAGEALLKGIDLDLKRQESIAIIGRNGAGKSTFADLLCGLESPLAGSVRVNSVPIISPLNGPSIAKLEQHPMILRDTLRNNLTMGHPGINETALRHMIERVGLGHWFATLPNGLESILGESGNTLSGGERQRLALARLALFSPSVAIFDESTSALDFESIHYFHRLIDELFADSARIVISHDLTAAERCDRLYELSKGKLCLKTRE